MVYDKLLLMKKMDCLKCYYYTWDLLDVIQDALPNHSSHSLLWKTDTSDIDEEVK